MTTFVRGDGVFSGFSSGLLEIGDLARYRRKEAEGGEICSLKVMFIHLKIRGRDFFSHSYFIVKSTFNSPWHLSRFLEYISF